jgi:uncharacterized alpha-E superfamily protein
MWVALELCDSTITYRTRYLGQLQPAPVLDLVMLDDSNPRSLVFQLRAIDGHLDYLARVSGVPVPPLPESLDHDLNAAVRQFAGDEQVWRHEGLALAMLRDIAADTDHKLDQLSEAITRAYFSHVPAAQAVGSSTA